MTTPDDVAVLFTDVSMPGALDGLTLAEMIHASCTDVRVVVIGSAAESGDAGRWCVCGSAGRLVCFRSDMNGA